MFHLNKTDKSITGLFVKKSATLDNKQPLVLKSNEDYMEMCFKPKFNVKTNVFILTPQVELDCIKYTYNLQCGTMKLNLYYEPNPRIKTGLTDLKIVLDYHDSILRVDQNTF